VAVTVVFSQTLPGSAVILAQSPRCRRGKGGPVEVLWRRPICVQLGQLIRFLQSTDRPPRPRRELSSRQAIDFFQQLHRLGREHHVAVAAGRRRWPFVLRPRRLVSAATSPERTQFPPGRRSLPAAPPVGSIHALLRTEHHVAVAAGRRRWPFVLRALRLVTFDRCRAHPRLTPSLESIE